ncbi:BTAD domain-containing putative transcriptional regulator [Amycolatopsis sp. NPDC088138]|uniref:AfsR/SARP family transcriptional regulator n=1 Tax=Amycolatopsis sp. NPDC088138 TaxID=3363938 RepID=UPI0037F59915
MARSFRILGPVEATVGGQSLSVTGRLLTLLTGLLVHANTTVSNGRIEQWLWDDDATAPKQAKAAIQTYMTRLRRVLGDDQVIRTVVGGYRLEADESVLDLLRFESLVSRGDVASLKEAVGLWRGFPLDGVASDNLHRDEVPRLSAKYLDAWERLADMLLELGDPPVAELQELTAQYPLHERFWEQLMVALYRSGRQVEALAAYRQVASILAEEAGLDPGPGLRAVQQQVLAGEPIASTATSRATATGWSAPHQLPNDVAGFAGRCAELAALPADPGLVVVEGTAGVGKTSLMVHFAHRVADGFPDGQIYLNLRGYGPGEPMSRNSSLDLLLQAIGLRPDQLPADVGAREALWRSRTAGRRMIVVLDNARSTTQIRPLLPGPGSLVLITSRAELRGLIAREGATRMSLTRMAPDEARAVLAKAIGEARTEADPHGVDEFLSRCAYLPLAIRVLGERASRFETMPLSRFLSEFMPAGLDGFDLDDDVETNLRAVFAPSYDALCEAAAGLFRQLGAHPGPDFGAGLASALADVPEERAAFLLDELVRAHLLERPEPRRYQFHDLLREYATELLGDEGGNGVIDWYAGAARAAFQRYFPHGNLAGLDIEPTIELADSAAATRWYEDEWENAVACVRHAFTGRRDRQAWQLTRLLQPFLGARGKLTDLLATHEAGLAAARRLDDPQAIGYMVNGIGIIRARQGRYDEAIRYFEERLVLARAVGDQAGERAALANLILPYQKVGRYRAALRAARQAPLADQNACAGKTAITLNNLAEAYLLAGQPERALAESRRAQELVPHGASLRVLGLAHEALGDLQVSASHLEGAVEFFKARGAELDEAELLRHLGRIRRLLGDANGARKALTAAMVRYRRLGYAEADEVLAEISGLTEAILQQDA